LFVSDQIFSSGANPDAIGLLFDNGRRLSFDPDT
jgi:hypothetical protein